MPAFLMFDKSVFDIINVFVYCASSIFICYSIGGGYEALLYRNTVSILDFDTGSRLDCLLAYGEHQLPLDGDARMWFSVLFVV